MRHFPFILSVFLAGAAWPQDLGMSWAPPLIDTDVSPGQKGNLEILITNDGPRPRTLYFEVLDLAQEPDGSYSIVERGAGNQSCADWLTLEAEQLTVGPGEDRPVAVSVEVPRRNIRGTYSAAILWSMRQRPPAEAEDTEATRLVFDMRFRMSTIVHLAVGKARPSDARAEIADMDIRLGKKGELVVSASLENQGSYNLYGKGQLIVRDANRRRLRHVPLGGGLGIVMPGSAVNFTSVFPSPPPPGTYSAESRIGYANRRTARAQRRFEVTGGGEAASAGDMVPAVDFGLEPDELVFDVRPGGFASKTLTLTNRSRRALNVSLGLKALDVTPEGQYLITERDKTGRSAKGWIQFRPQQFMLRRGGKRVVRINTQAPKEAHGGAYASVVCVALPADARASEASLPTENAVPVLVAVGSGESAEPVLSELHPTVTADFRGARFRAELANQGTVHFRPQGAQLLIERLRRAPEGLRVLDGAEYIGSEDRWDAVGAGRVLLPSSYILPDHSAAVQAMYIGDLEPGQYRGTLVLMCGDEAPLEQVARFEVPDRDKAPRAPGGGDAAPGGGPAASPMPAGADLLFGLPTDPDGRAGAGVPGQKRETGSIPGEPEGG